MSTLGRGLGVEPLKVLSVSPRCQSVHRVRHKDFRPYTALRREDTMKGLG